MRIVLGRLGEGNIERKIFVMGLESKSGEEGEKWFFKCEDHQRYILI